jgi:hypothetical protein
MKQLAFAFGLLVLSVPAATVAHADFAVVRFASGYCRVWGPPAAPAQDFQYLAFRRGWHHPWWQHFFIERGNAEAALQEAIATGRCHKI